MTGLDKQDYPNKDQDLLADNYTYKAITGDPTSRHKNKLIPTLRTIKAQGRLSDRTYKRLYPNDAVAPNYMVFPKSINMAPSLSPIVSSRGAITYDVAKELASIIRPLVGQVPDYTKTPNTLWNI